MAHAVRKGWWRLYRPQLTACRVLALDAAGHVLLVRHSYGSGKWMLPGGGIKSGEDPIASARREYAEEVGGALQGCAQVDVTRDIFHGAPSTVHVIVGLASGPVAPDRREIVVAAFHAPDALPEALASGLAEAIPHWLALYRADQNSSI
ncbi:NUDIX domain-containing protein [Novosphingobium sp. FSY-8]|uniref:NUDIX domain-containing protein n=2 Tax=Novosphingobium ovatum TaxID=1908523 RepID=A0ABW9XGU0_9SPHN|nr:NUDIX domain-containing protein [Novosphingobium ovatum]